MPCGFCENRRFGRTRRLHHPVKRICELGTTLAVTSNRSTFTRATRRHIPEDGILHSHRRKTFNLTYVYKLFVSAKHFIHFYIHSWASFWCCKAILGPLISKQNATNKSKSDVAKNCYQFLLPFRISTEQVTA
jgi:hypothetical protein